MEIRSTRTILLVGAIGVLGIACLLLIVGFFFTVQLKNAENASATTATMNNAATAQVAQGTATSEQATLTSEAEPTVFAKATALAAETQVATDANWPLILSDNFDSNLNLNDWIVGKFTTQLGDSERHIAYGKYIWNWKPKAMSFGLLPLVPSLSPTLN